MCRVLRPLAVSSADYFVTRCSYLAWKHGNCPLCYDYVIAGERIACSEQFRQGIARFTEHSWDFVRKMHDWYFCLLPARCHTLLIFYKLINKSGLQTVIKMEEIYPFIHWIQHVCNWRVTVYIDWINIKTHPHFSHLISGLYTGTGK